MPIAKVITKPVTIILILLLIVMGQSAVDIYLPSLPFIAKQFVTDHARIQLTLSIYLLGFGCSQLIYGPFSDYLGRRPILLLGLPIFLLASIGCALSPSPELLLFFRLLQGLGAGAASVIARALMRDSFEGKELSRVASYMAMAWAMVPMVAPALGGYLQTFFGWRSNFVVLTIFAVLLISFVIFRLPETNKNLNGQSISLKSVSKNYFSLLRNNIFLGNILCLIIVFGIFVIFNMAGPFLLQTQLGLSPITYGWILVIISSGYLLGSYVNSKIIRQCDAKKVTLSGMYLITCSSLLMLLAVSLGYFSVLIIVLPMFMIFLGLGFVFANCVAACLSPFPHIAGSASAMYGFLVFLGGCLISALFTRFPAQTALPLACSLALLSILMLCIFYTVSIKAMRNLSNNPTLKLPE